MLARLGVARIGTADKHSRHAPFLRLTAVKRVLPKYFCTSASFDFVGFVRTGWLIRHYRYRRSKQHS
jgi:hypothetical protein